MMFYITLFIIIFSMVFLVSLFCMVKKELIFDTYHLIIPSICIGLWALYSLINTNFTTRTTDIYAFYHAGKQLFIDPSTLYDAPGFHYMPIYSILFAFTISLLPFSIACDIFFIVNYIWGVFTILEFNKILILKDVKEKLHRLLFLLIISNGYFVFNQFFWNQSKYLLFLIFLIIIRRELQIRKNKREKDLKYYLINYSLIVLAIGMAPYFIFFLIIYVFHDIPLNEFFKKDHVNKYFIIITMFIAQNFLFFIYPSQFFIFFFSGIFHPIRRKNKMKLIYLREFVEVSYNTMTLITIVFTTILSITTIILIIKEKFLIEEKFGYFSLAYILFGVYSYPHLLSLILFSLVLLLFVPYINQDNNNKAEFFKNNKVLFIGLFSIIGILFASGDFIIFRFFSNLEEFPVNIFYYSRWIILLGLMIFSYIDLNLKTRRLTIII